MKKTRRTLSVLLSGCLLFGTAASFVTAKEKEHDKGNRVEFEYTFKDIKKAPWAEGYIKKMKSKNILKGYEDGTFRPNQPVTQVEAIVTAVKLMGLENEALAKSKDAVLHFKDAELIDKKYSWAKGYILVALEHGLFDTDLDRLEPAKPASRVWVASLLVKSLGLELEALSQMTESPDFKDAPAIPAGAIGYINVALKHGLISGYPNGTFQPNKPVTRAEMAVFLDRTNEDRLEQEGAVRVNGTITSVQFPTGDADKIKGYLTVQTFDGKQATYAISPKLLVKHNQDVIPAIELTVHMPISLLVRDNEVIEASLWDNHSNVPVSSEVIGLSVEIELNDDEEYELEYKNRNGVVEAKLETPQEKVKGQAAAARVADMLKAMNLTPELSDQEVINRILTALNIKEGAYDELEIKLQYANGKKISIERENNEAVNKRPEHGIREFELKAKLPGKDQLVLKYKNNGDKIEASVERTYKKDKQKLTGKAAVEYIEKMIKQAALTDKMSESEIAKRLTDSLNIKLEHLKEVEVELEFFR